jgi:hypothetical protein
VRAATRKDVVDLDEDKFQETFTLYTMLVYIISLKSFESVRALGHTAQPSKNYRKIV